ncbi:MAG: 3',5'-cyclic-nucleotide phosphodiesterase [Mariprofundales bacterium]
MRFKVLGCYGGQLLGFHLSSFLVNGSVLLDAGAPTEALTLEEQHEIRHIFISHTHLDHIKDIAFLSDNRSLKRLGGARQNRKLYVYSLPANIQDLRQYFLNNHIWPDFTVIPTAEDPIIVLREIQPEKPITVDGVTITPIMVNHPVPCTAFLIEQDGKQIIYSADTGHTDRMWEIANNLPDLRGVILDCSFPNAYERLAGISGHLTPQGVGKELKKFKHLGEIPVYLFHMKPETLSKLTYEVAQLNLPYTRMLTQVDELIL